ncbi:MAG: hypothetical protein FJ290_06370 [Planctomycetes bacterium]|nr:hypothetical protein [Planctomycetota bacterium]
MARRAKRITVSLDDTDLQFAKSYAAKHDVPLSRVIEIALWRLKANPTEPDLVEAVTGTLVLRKRPGDPRYEYLKKKYGL